MNQALRLFIAIELPQGARDLLARAITDLRAQGLEGLRWVRPEGIHLTLKFLGDVQSERVESILQGMAGACHGYRPFELSLGELGVFPGLRRPRVLWIGVGGEVEYLASLQQRVEEEMARVGFAVENRPFSPHLTLARVSQGAKCDRLAEVVDASKSPIESAFVWQANQVHLVRSTLLPQGAVYQTMGSQELVRPAT